MFTLPDLPYAYDALEPYIDEATMRLHHDKHHQKYLDSFNTAIEGTDLEHKTAEEILRNLESVPENIRTAVRNHGGGYVNHSLFWTVMGPKGSSSPEGELESALSESFGSLDSFKEKFSSAAAGQFGSGWAWLVLNSEGKLEITSTSNQDTPSSDGAQPILLLDVWEHAYYLKYQNKRADYIEAWWNVVNWKQVMENYATAKKDIATY